MPGSLSLTFDNSHITKTFRRGPGCLMQNAHIVVSFRFMSSHLRTGAPKKTHTFPGNVYKLYGSSKTVQQLDMNPDSFWLWLWSFFILKAIKNGRVHAILHRRQRNIPTVFVQSAQPMPNTFASGCPLPSEGSDRVIDPINSERRSFRNERCK